MPLDQAGVDIVEIGRDYLVLEDTEAGVRTRIPWHLIYAAATPVPVAPPPLAQSA